MEVLNTLCEAELKVMGEDSEEVMSEEEEAGGWIRPQLENIVPKLIQGRSLGVELVVSYWTIHLLSQFLK